MDGVFDSLGQRGAAAHTSKHLCGRQNHLEWIAAIETVHVGSTLRMDISYHINGLGQQSILVECMQLLFDSEQSSTHLLIFDVEEDNVVPSSSKDLARHNLKNKYFSNGMLERFETIEIRG